MSIFIFSCFPHLGLTFSTITMMLAPKVGRKIEFIAARKVVFPDVLSGGSQSGFLWSHSKQAFGRACVHPAVCNAHCTMILMCSAYSFLQCNTIYIHFTLYSVYSAECKFHIQYCSVLLWTNYILWVPVQLYRRCNCSDSVCIFNVIHIVYSSFTLFCAMCVLCVLQFQWVGVTL